MFISILTDKFYTELLDSNTLDEKYAELWDSCDTVIEDFFRYFFRNDDYNKILVFVLGSNNDYIRTKFKIDDKYFNGSNNIQIICSKSRDNGITIWATCLVRFNKKSHKKLDISKMSKADIDELKSKFRMSTEYSINFKYYSNCTVEEAIEIIDPFKSNTKFYLIPVSKV